MKYLLSLIGPGYACAKRVADLLVVDDDSDVAAPLLELLQLEGHTVRWAEDGLAGLVCISQRIPDLILLDVEMPQMSGPEMGAELFACNQGREKIPILLLSGTADLTQTAKAVGTPYFLPKPYHLERLLQLLDQALRERRPPVRQTVA